MKATTIINECGIEITIYHNRYGADSIHYKHPGEYWCFSVEVNRYRYKTVQPLIRYNATIVAKRFDIQNQLKEEIDIYYFNQRGFGELNKMLDKAHTLLQILLQAIDNGDPVWDVRELLTQ